MGIYAGRVQGQQAFYTDKKTRVQTIKTQEEVCTLDTKYYANEAIRYTRKREISIDST